MRAISVDDVVAAAPAARRAVERRERLEHRAVVGPEHVEEVLGRAVAEHELARLRLDRSGRVARTSRRGARACPTAPATSTPAGGGRYLPSVLNSWPMKPSGRPVGEADLAAAACRRAAARPPPASWFGVNITPKVETTTSKQASANGSASASASWNSIVRPSAAARGAAALEQRRHVVGRGHLAPAARGGERGVAVAGGDVEHRLAGAQIERLAQLLADDLQGRADDGVVAGRPGGLLAGLDGGEIGRCGWRGCGRGAGCGQGGGHGRAFRGWFLTAPH